MPIITTIRGNIRPFGKARGIGLASTGGTITTVGGYRIHTFTTPGNNTFTADTSGQVEYLVVAGGGGGGRHWAGGGGAGGFLTGTLPVISGSISVVVGSGGGGGNTDSPSTEGKGRDGGSSQFSSISSVGGGGGGWGSGRKSILNSSDKELENLISTLFGGNIDNYDDD